MYLTSTIFAKIVYAIIKLSKAGAGFTWPGNIVLKIYPHIIRDIKKKLPEKIVFISGTNGKTTTAKLVAHILRKSGYKVLHNDTGANLLNGIVSTVLLSTNLQGELDFDYAVFELDEFTLPKIIKEIHPKVLALLNLSRDQLDRHWEIDIIFDKWQEAIESLKRETVIILDSEQEIFRKIKGGSISSIFYFDGNTKNLEKTKLIGIFNAKNVNCALLIVQKLGLDMEEARQHLTDFDFAYGRGESVEFKHKSYQLFLAKNPESLNQNLKLLKEFGVNYDTILFILNDHVPDGHDVSWIYDVFPEIICEASKGKNIFVSGTRALDMGVRLSYAGISLEDNRLETDLSQVITDISKCVSCKNVVILPNYSAMLEVRQVIRGRKIL